MKKQRFYFLLVLLTLFLGAFFFSFPHPARALELYSMRERFGVGVDVVASTGVIPSNFDFDSLHIGWYLNWSYTSPGHIQGLEFMPLVGGYGSGYNASACQKIKTAVAANPSLYPSGTTWSIGNEIGLDDGSSPQVYAQTYAGWLECLKKINPTFQVAFGALVNPEFILNASWIPQPIALKDYLVQVKNHYENTLFPGRKLVPDVFISHAYLHGYDTSGAVTAADHFNVFKQVIYDTRSLMKKVGWQSVPLVIKEFSLPAIYDENIQKEFLRLSHEFLATAYDKDLGNPLDDYRLVQRWAWFVANDGEAQYEGDWDEVALFDSDTKVIKPLGLEFRKVSQRFVFGEEYQFANAGFESGSLSPWSIWSSVSGSRAEVTNQEKFSGNYSSSVSVGGLTSGTGGSACITQGLPETPFLAGKKAFLAGWTKTSRGEAFLKLNYTALSGQRFSNYSAGYTPQVSGSAWQKLEKIVPLPQDLLKVDLDAFATGDQAQVWFDNLVWQIVGDLDGDFHLSRADLKQFFLKYRSPSQNPLLDSDRDGVITAKDIVEIYL